MASDFIVADRTQSGQKFATDVVQCVQLLRSTVDLLDSIKGRMDHLIDGSDYSRLESLFGLQAGNGQPTYNLVAGALAAISGSVDATTLINRVGG